MPRFQKLALSALATVVALTLLSVTPAPADGPAAAPAATQPALTSKPVTKDGLQVTVTSAKASYAAGEAINLTVQFKNTSDKAFALYDYNWFWTWSLQFENTAEHWPWQVHLLIMVKRAPETRVVKPGETIEVPIDLDTHPSLRLHLGRHTDQGSPAHHPTSPRQVPPHHDHPLPGRCRARCCPLLDRHPHPRPPGNRNHRQTRRHPTRPLTRRGSPALPAPAQPYRLPSRGTLSSTPWPSRALAGMPGRAHEAHHSTSLL